MHSRNRSPVTWNWNPTISQPGDGLTNSLLPWASNDSLYLLLCPTLHPLVALNEKAWGGGSSGLPPRLRAMPRRDVVALGRAGPFGASGLFQLRHDGGDVLSVGPGIHAGASPAIPDLFPSRECPGSFPHSLLSTRKFWTTPSNSKHKETKRKAILGLRHIPMCSINQTRSASLDASLRPRKSINGDGLPAFRIYHMGHVKPHANSADRCA